VNGEYIDKAWFVEFVRREQPFFGQLQASFFEVTTAMALRYFADQRVDIAVIEVGLGGRLDCTNVITPILSIITNISLDHTALLGHTSAAIAAQKAGIIKRHIPVLIGEADEETRPVFEAIATELHAPIEFAQDDPLLLSADTAQYCALSPFAPDPDRLLVVDNPYWQPPKGVPQTFCFTGNLTGLYQERNTETILHALRILYRQGCRVDIDSLRAGFADVRLQGRWQVFAIRNYPTICICDTAHNPAGMAYVARQLQQLLIVNCQLSIVLGMVSDKDVRAVLQQLPQGDDVQYYFTQPSVSRALPCKTLQSIAAETGRHGTAYPTLAKALADVFVGAGSARPANPAPTVEWKRHVVFVGGSTFLVADLLAQRDSLNLH
jgi:dihydrofolate synthase/folylpolyglutamate synthase